MADYPSNSNKSKAVDKVTKAVGDTVKINGKSVGEHIVDDMIIPGAKRYLYDMVGRTLRYLTDTGMQVLSNLLFDSNIPPAMPSNGSSANQGIAYNSFSKSSSSAPTIGTTTKIYNSPRDYISNLVFGNQIEATDCLNRLMETVNTYGKASIVTLYNIAGKTAPSNIANNWGWNVEMFTNFRCSLLSVPGGYILELPEPIRI